MQGNNEERKRKQVIVRAWGDEPVVCNLYTIENNRCYVGSSAARRPIGLPFDQVYAFNSTLFHSLTQAYEEGDLAKLRSLYESIQVDDFACNRYQNNLECVHDQEHLADSEGNAGSDSQ
jgi:hypothetical protein